MTPSEKRKFLRLDALHLLDYLLVDQDGNESDYAMARTLDVSINGIKVETIRPIPSQARMIITLGIEENLIDISARQVHTHETANRFVSGVEFSKVAVEDRKVLRRYVDEFQSRKESLLKEDFPSERRQVV